MRKFLIAGFIAIAALSLAACDPQVEIQKVQGATVAGCKYLPTAETVANIAKTIYSPLGPYVNAASTIADKICYAVTSVPLADGPGDRLPRVNGVIVKGTFVK